MTCYCSVDKKVSRKPAGLVPELGSVPLYAWERQRLYYHIGAKHSTSRGSPV